MSYMEVDPPRLLTPKSSSNENKELGLMGGMESWKKADSGLFHFHGGSDLLDPLPLDTMNIGENAGRLTESANESLFFRFLKMDSRTDQGFINLSH
jgi:hypothetical protein